MADSRKSEVLSKVGRAYVIAKSVMFVDRHCSFSGVVCVCYVWNAATSGIKMWAPGVWICNKLPYLQLIFCWAFEAIVRLFVECDTADDGGWTDVNCQQRAEMMNNKLYVERELANWLRHCKHTKSHSDKVTEMSFNWLKLPPPATYDRPAISNHCIRRQQFLVWYCACVHSSRVGVCAVRQLVRL